MSYLWVHPTLLRGGTMRFLCQPCDHRWWQHKNPDPQERYAGIALMVMGAVQVTVGILLIIKYSPL